MKTSWFFAILLSLAAAFASACSPVSISGTGNFIGRRAYYLMRTSDPCDIETTNQAGACAVLSKFASSDEVGLLGNFTRYPGGGAVDGQLNCNGQFLLSEITNFDGARWDSCYLCGDGGRGGLTAVFVNVGGW